MNKQECIEIIKGIKIGYLATCDDNFQPYVRPIDMGTLYDGKIYFSTFDNTNKVNQINEINKVEAVFLHDYSQIRVEGVVEKIDDTKIIDNYMMDNKSISEMNDKSEGTKLIVYCITPRSVKYMASDVTSYSIISWS